MINNVLLAHSTPSCLIVRLIISLESSGESSVAGPCAAAAMLLLLMGWAMGFLVYGSVGRLRK